MNAKGRAIEPLPRGTVLAWTAAFLSIGGHDDDAKAFAAVLARDFCEPLPAFAGAVVEGARACREWPRGVDRKADAVSGPLFMGYGSGASALAIGAFRATGDEAAAKGLEALMPLAPMLARVPDVAPTPSVIPSRTRSSLGARASQRSHRSSSGSLQHVGRGLAPVLGVKLRAARARPTFSS